MTDTFAKVGLKTASSQTNNAHTCMKIWEKL